MWDEIQIQCCDANEIAEALINNEVSLVQLESVPVFAAKSRLVEEAVWGLCESNNSISMYLSYLNIYPNGIHAREVDEKVGHLARTIDTLDAFRIYLDFFPNGIYAEAVKSMRDSMTVYGPPIVEIVEDESTEDALWNLCKSRNDYQCYMDIYPFGKHRAEAEKQLAAIRREEEAWYKTLRENSIEGYLQYHNTYLQGIHACEVDDIVWNLVQTVDTRNAFHIYLNNFPNGIHAEEAKMRIDDFYGPIIGIIDDRNWLEKKRIIDALADDCNAYSLDYLKAMEFVPDDLVGILRDSRGQVRNEVLNSWRKKPLHLDLGKTPESIPTGTTEVYFWGIPGAGHTCLIASILNVAKRIGVYCSRSETVNDLASVFDDNSSTPAVHLPAATFADGIQCLPLSLIENKGKKKIEHRLSIMEHSGELFEGFSMELCGQPFSGGGRHGSYERLKMWLSNSNNSKYHFFIVDAKPSLDNPQQRYIEEAVLYFKQAGLFNETTQGISIIVTKCDELSPDSSEWPQLATEYIKNCYPAMVNQLKQIVGPKRHGGLDISDGTIQVIPFSIGDVFLQKLCLFNPEPAERMVKMLLECSPTHKGWLDWIKKVFP